MADLRIVTDTDDYNDSCEAALFRFREDLAEHGSPMVSVALVAVTRDGFVHTVLDGGGCRFIALGAVHRLAYRLQAQIDGEGEVMPADMKRLYEREFIRCLKEEAKKRSLDSRTVAFALYEAGFRSKHNAR